jgi:hypothetical protein
MKICHVIFSTNRIEYLTKTLESHKLMDFGDHEITRILVDDYPKNRNTNIFYVLQKLYKIDKLWLHEENKGLSVNWTELFTWLRKQNFDYILHQEDDVVLLEPIKLDDLIEFLQTYDQICSVVLERQKWYHYETEPTIKDTDFLYKNKYYVESKNFTFPIIFSLYPSWIVHEDIVKEYGFNYNEGIMMVHLKEKHNKFCGFFKNINGKNLIQHIGVTTQGKRVLKGEPNYEFFSYMDPEKTYNTLTLEEVE